MQLQLAGRDWEFKLDEACREQGLRDLMRQLRWIRHGQARGCVVSWFWHMLQETKVSRLWGLRKRIGIFSALSYSLRHLRQNSKRKAISTWLLNCTTEGINWMQQHTQELQVMVDALRHLYVAAMAMCGVARNWGDMREAFTTMRLETRISRVAQVEAELGRAGESEQLMSKVWSMDKLRAVLYEQRINVLHRLTQRWLLNLALELRAGHARHISESFAVHLCLALQLMQIEVLRGHVQHWRKCQVKARERMVKLRGGIRALLAYHAMCEARGTTAGTAAWGVCRWKSNFREEFDVLVAMKLNGIQEARLIRLDRSFALHTIHRTLNAWHAACAAAARIGTRMTRKQRVFLHSGGVLRLWCQLAVKRCIHVWCGHWRQMLAEAREQQQRLKHKHMVRGVAGQITLFQVQGKSCSKNNNKLSRQYNFTLHRP